MHVFERVQVVDPFADVPKVSLDFIFWELAIAELYFIVEAAAFGKL